MRATTLSFERRYGDDSGVEYGVTLKRGHSGEDIVQVHSGCDVATFNLSELDWFIEQLDRIRSEVRYNTPKEAKP